MFLAHNLKYLIKFNCLLLKSLIRQEKLDFLVFYSRLFGRMSSGMNHFEYNMAKYARSLWSLQI